MIRRLETLPNEILLIIFSDLSWSELLTSLWSLNKRFDFLICFNLSRIDNYSNSGIIINEPGLSFNKCHSILFRLIHDSSLPIACCIRRIHIDGTNSNACDLIDKYLFDKEKNIVHFPNLKSLVLTRCLVLKSLIKTLPFLIKHQLDALLLSFDEDVIQVAREEKETSKTGLCEKKLIIMFKQLIRQLFSAECRLTSLRLDIAFDDSSLDLHESLITCENFFPNSSIFVKYESCCITLRRLYIHLEYTCFLEHLIEHVPFLEQLSVKFKDTMSIWRRSKSDMEILMKSNANWFDKVPKLERFILKTYVYDDFEFAYLKWILNNLNHIKKLKIHISSQGLYGTDKVIWNSVVDANFVRRYCMPDTAINLTHLDFYISSQYKLPMNNVEKIIHSFKIHPFFLHLQCTNIKCFLDPIRSYQYLGSSIDYTPLFFVNLIGRENLCKWSHMRYVCIDLHPSLYHFLEQFDEVFPNVFCIKVYVESVYCSIDRHQARSKLLANLISMPIQLKDFRINDFEWLLHIVEYASDELKKNALNSVRYAEISIPSCHIGSNESIHIGKNLVPFLSAYMPNLQTLRIWRPDDFPWTSIRPNYKPGYLSGKYVPLWYNSLRTPELINQHVALFEEDLNQLVKHLKELVFLDIHGKIHQEKVAHYRSMVHARFPNSRHNVELCRFRLWL